MFAHVLHTASLRRLELSAGERSAPRSLRRSGHWLACSALLTWAATTAVAPSRAMSSSDTTTVRATSDLAPRLLAARVGDGRTIRVSCGSQSLVYRSPEFSTAGILPTPQPASQFQSGGPGYRPPEPLPWERIDRIEVRGSHARAGTIIGVIAGGVVGIPFGMAFEADPFLGKGSSGAGLVLVVGTGVLAGACVGVLVGWAIPKWNAVYHRGERRE